MRSTWSKVTVAAAVSAVAVGCAPVVSVRHTIPAALPLPEDAAVLRAGDFTVRSGPKADFAAFMKQALGERLKSDCGDRAGGAAEVGGTLDVETKDVRGKRLARRLDPTTGKLENVELPTLVRTAAVRVNFHVRRAAGGQLGAVEVRRSYSSAADAEVRGELGLQRPDDPQRVPSVEKIVQRLLTECIDSFRRMTAPVEVTAEVAMRPAAGRSGELGLEAAGKADYGEAVRHFQAAVAAAPDDADLHFNLAAAAEAAGKLPLAAKHYGRSWELSKQTDTEARQAAARTRRVLAARK